jgi:hypothetical protein
MNKIKSTFLVAMLMASRLLADVDESNQNFGVSDGFLAAGDLVIVRPISSAATIGAFAIFAVVSPFTEMAGCTGETYEGLVEKPGKFSFDRELGDFNK